MHLSQGSSVADAIRQISVSEVTYYRWRQEFGGLKISQVKRLKELETENARLWLADGSCMRLRAEHANILANTPVFWLALTSSDGIMLAASVVLSDRRVDSASREGA